LRVTSRKTITTVRSIGPKKKNSGKRKGATTKAPGKRRSRLGRKAIIDEKNSRGVEKGKCRRFKKATQVDKWRERKGTIREHLVG